MIFLFGCTELFPDVPEVPEFKAVKTENLAEILGFILGRNNISGKESWWKLDHRSFIEKSPKPLTMFWPVSCKKLKIDIGRE